jgi:hypothetical protein
LTFQHQAQLIQLLTWARYLVGHVRDIVATEIPATEAS